ncbi:hypothetical protein GQ53DRAFT_350098 [Thozetella sp. PMI_491]|nr:hypothetical protein GQ53DRAFT_350098 [Thozetella sp. PMI_491]
MKLLVRSIALFATAVVLFQQPSVAGPTCLAPGSLRCLHSRARSGTVPHDDPPGPGTHPGGGGGDPAPHPGGDPQHPNDGPVQHPNDGPVQHPGGPDVPPNPAPAPEPAPKDLDPAVDPRKSNPGFGELEGGEPKPMSDYVRSGSNQLNAYTEAVSTHRADTPLVSSVDKYDNIHFTNLLDLNADKSGYGLFDYEVEIPAMDGDIKPLLTFKQEHLGFDPAPMMNRQGTRVKITNGIRQDNPISEGVYDPQGEWAVIEAELKSSDNNPGKRIPVNELTWQAQVKVFKTNTGKLKVMFIENVRNKGFCEITKQNYIETNKALDSVAVWEPGTVYFNRMLGSDNLSGKFNAWSNHHTAFGDKEIERIATMPRQVAGSDGFFHVAVVFKK